MAIKYKLRNTHTYNGSSSRLYLEDDTGLYSTSNLGGYGLPNSLRSDVALIPVGYYKASKGSRQVTFDKYNPLTATVFNAVIAADGWYEFHLLALPIYNPLQLATYTVGDSYYNSLTGEVLVVNNLLNVNIVKVIDPIKLVGTKYEVAKTEDELVVASNTKIMIRLNSLVSDLITNNVDFKDKKLIRLKDNYNTVRIILQGSLYEFARGNKAVAQKNLEFLNTNDYLKV